MPGGVEESWTILELAGLAADVLAAEPDGPVRANGRVRDVPNGRLIRWYATVGLVDPPLSRRGRVARYGRRHLLQLVAVKRRQAEGRSLSEIQAEFTGATDEMLAEAARLPTGWPPSVPSAPGAAESPDGDPMAPADPAAPSRFWTHRPSPVPIRADQAGSREPADFQEPDEAKNGAAPAPARASLVHGIQLIPGVTLLLEDAQRAPGPDDITAIADAAEPLLQELARRSLLNEQPADLGEQPTQGA